MAMKSAYTWSNGDGPDWDRHLHALPELLKAPGARICRSKHFTFSEQLFSWLHLPNILLIQWKKIK